MLVVIALALGIVIVIQLALLILMMSLRDLLAGLEMNGRSDLPGEYWPTDKGWKEIDGG